MPESLNQRIGGIELPVLDTDISATDRTFAAADPALAVVAAFCAAVIRAELGSDTTGAWYRVTSALPGTHRLHDSSNPVADIWTIEPSGTALRQVKAGFPLLAVWRDGKGEYEQFTTVKEFVRQRWGVMWAVGDIEADLALKLGPALHIVARAICAAVVEGRHPAYQSGARIWGDDYGRFAMLRPVEYEAGAARFSEDEEARFWAASVTLESLEEVAEVDAPADAEPLSLGLTAAVGDGLELWPGLVVGDGDFTGS